MMSEMIVDLNNILLLCDSSIPLVIAKNTGIVPNGLVRVKKEVRQIKAKGRSDSMIYVLMQGSKLKGGTLLGFRLQN